MRIANDGPKILSTDYWQTPHAAAGYAYLSGNAGALRLLVPPPLEPHIVPDMAPAKRIIIERAGADMLCITFDDATDAPFRLDMSLLQTDRKFSAGKDIPFLVYTRAGLALEFRAVALS